MAVKPREEDSFVREVDEEVRRERVSSFFSRYGWLVIGAVALILVMIGGFIWWQNQQRQAAGEQSEKLVQVIEQLENNPRGAAPAIDELATSDRPAYRYSALFARANAQVSTGAIPAAIATLASIAGDADAPQPYRDVAIIRQTQLEFDGMTPGQAAQRLRPYAQAGNPFFGSAGEMMGVALIRGGRPEQAAQMFAALARDPNVAQSIRARALQMASALGVDAVQIDPSLLEAGPPPPPSPVTQTQPAVPPGTAPAGNAAQANDTATRNAAR